MERLDTNMVYRREKDAVFSERQRRIIFSYRHLNRNCAVPKKFESPLSCVSFNFSVSLDNNAQ